MTQANATTDIDALKTRLKATWMDGNYDYFSRFMESSAVELLDRLDIPAGLSLLDVACGSGQLGLIAARRGIRVTGVDIATNAILAARSRANAEGLGCTLRRGRRGGASVRGRELRRGGKPVRRDVRSAPGAGGGRASARLPAGRNDCDGQLDRGRLHRHDVQDLRAVHRAAGNARAGALGRRAHCRASGSDQGLSQLRLTRVGYRFDYPFGPADVVEFFRDRLRTDDARVRRARRGRTSSASRGAC